MVLTLFEQAPVAQTNTLKKRFFEIFNSIIWRVRARTVEKNIFFLTGQLFVILLQKTKFRNTNLVKSYDFFKKRANFRKNALFRISLKDR